MCIRDRDVLTQPGTNVAIFCNKLFACETVTISLTDLDITTTSIYIGEGFQIEAVPPNQATSGKDGATFGEDGTSGSPGLPAPNVIIEADSIMDTVRTGYSMVYKSQGGKGGNGGRGHAGDPEGVTKPSADSIVSSGSRLGSTCLLYTSPSPRDLSTSRMPSSA